MWFLLEHLTSTRGPIVGAVPTVETDLYGHLGVGIGNMEGLVASHLGHILDFFLPENPLTQPPDTTLLGF